MKQSVYFFEETQGLQNIKDILGSKGAGLAEMTRIGVPVPPGFTISSDVCNYYEKKNNRFPSRLREEVQINLARLERVLDKKFGNFENPLLLSVRSGARVSMPGMMDTVLNLGLNDETVEGLALGTQNERFALDSYRRFIQMFGDVVLGVDYAAFEEKLKLKKQKNQAKNDTELSTSVLRELIGEYKELVLAETGRLFPHNTEDQLWLAIAAVIRSWNSPRALKYRKIHDIPHHWGTAVTVQAMVFGNMGEDSATGVAFTRDPSTGERKFFGEYLINAQGEDVVAGIRTPNTIHPQPGSKGRSLQEALPQAYASLVEVYQRLEKHYRDMQDIEFTIEKGKLWLLQTRSGKRSAKAAIRIAVDMVKEGLIDKETAILRVPPIQLNQLLHPMLDPKATKAIIAHGLPASPGAASGIVVFSPDEAEIATSAGKKVILVRVETSPEDIHGMNISQGILTTTGGMTSHAAVVGRGMGKPCVVGCADIQVDYKSQSFQAGERVVQKGELVTIDGSTGEVILGSVPMVQPELDGYFKEFMSWVDEIRGLKVRGNADTPHDTEVAVQFGAEGIGLCRTEHMFFGESRIKIMREMILADNAAARREALVKILPLQKEDFKGIFVAMNGKPVNIRLLDPPLHEFVPQKKKEMIAVSEKMGIPYDVLKRKVQKLKEFNPMLGHRGCRLGISYPEIYETQVHAIMEAACELVKEKGMVIIPEIMIPLVGDVTELQKIREYSERLCREIMRRYDVTVPYSIGTMIELPRAALTADRIAEVADFFSFGTNDLTQTTYGLSRDDAGIFLPRYLEEGIFKQDPFVTIDQEGVGRLMRTAIKLGKKKNPTIKIGICGEHGGDPESVEFCYEIGLDYVSCSPYRIPIARLAAAQATIRRKQAV